jgi:hypothetical protein
MTIARRRVTTILGGLAALFAAMGSARIARAGSKEVWPVFIYFPEHHAWGQLGATRDSPDDKSYIAISINVDGNDKQLGQIVFDDGKGQVISCNTTSERKVRALEAAASDAVIDVYWDDKKNCEIIEITNASYNPPKRP